MAWLTKLQLHVATSSFSSSTLLLRTAANSFSTSYSSLGTAYTSCCSESLTRTALNRLRHLHLARNLSSSRKVWDSSSEGAWGKRTLITTTFAALGDPTLTSCSPAPGRFASCRNWHTKSGQWKEVGTPGGNIYNQTISQHVPVSKHEEHGEEKPSWEHEIGQQKTDGPQLPGLRRTVWDQQDLKPAYPKLSRDLSTDVVVVGAGIAGLSVAYNLVKAGKSVVVLEARARGAGMTGRTTAHIMPWFDDFYSNVERDFGLAKAKIVGESYRCAIDWVDQVVKEEGINCEFLRLDGYLFPHEDTKEAHDSLQQEYEASRRVGFDVQMVDLGKDPASGQITTAIRFPSAGEFHPLMYLDGLAEAVVKRGGRIYELSRVMKNEGNQVTTEDGFTVTAGAVVLATCSPINHNLTIHARQTPHRTYVIGLRVPKHSVKRAQYWDTGSPYHYVRIEPKGDHDILVVGGEDTSVGMKPTEYHDPYRNLERWARKRWTMAEDVEYTWTGIVFDPADYLHLIGPDPLEIGKKDQFVVTGDSGQGMTGGTIAGILLSDLIVGKQNTWFEVYDPRRLLPISKSTLKSIGEEVAHTIHGYKDFLPVVGTDSVDIEDLLPNSGAVIQKGLQKVAVYKDPNGSVYQYTAVCPHMKCVVKWNPIDATFDCPCHGSSFDKYGRQICGPAKADLKPVQIS